MFAPITSMTMLTSYGYLRVQGKDALAFLQGQLTCDVKQASPSTALLGAYCNIKGRMHCIFTLFNPESDVYLMQLPAGPVLEHTEQVLKKYAVFSKITIQKINYNTWGIALDNPSAQPSLPTLPYECVTEKSSILMCTPRETTSPYRWLLVSEQNTSEPDILSSLSSIGYNTVSDATWHEWNILAGLPMVYPQTIEQLLPHDVSLPAIGGVSFKKGCYLGQEIIARMEYRGNLKKHLKLIELPSVDYATLPLPGDIYQDNIIVDAAYTDNNIILALIIAI